MLAKMRAKRSVHVVSEMLLERVDRYSRNQRNELILVVDCTRGQHKHQRRKRRGLTVSTVLLRALVRSMLDLDGDSCSSLALLDDLLDLVVDLKRSTTKDERVSGEKSRNRAEYVHLAKVDDLLLLRLGVGANDTERSPNAQSSLGNVASNDDSCVKMSQGGELRRARDRRTITLGEAGDDLELAGPNGLWCGVDTLRLDDTGVVGLERVEKMVDDVGCEGGVGEVATGTEETTNP